LQSGGVQAGIATLPRSSWTLDHRKAGTMSTTMTRGAKLAPDRDRTLDPRTWGRQMLNKVPEITLYFWVIKVLCTTVGETAADYLNSNLGLGLSGTSYVMSAVLIVALVFQFASRRYKPGTYWLSVVLISVVGTLISDNLVDGYGIPLQTTTIVFGVALALTFAWWYASEGTLSIHTIFTTRREAFYWAAVLFTFALGTSAGDFLSEKLALGYLNAVFLFAGAIAVVALAHFVFRLNAILSFWLAYILTRPLGASIGDYMSQAKPDGGLGLGTTVTSFIFLGVILALVVYLAVTRVDVIPSVGRRAKAGPREPHAETRVLVVTNKTDATPALLEAVRARAASGPAMFFMLVPNPDHLAFDRSTPDHPRGDEILARALPVIEGPAGGEVNGRVANSPNAYDDIVEELEGEDYDEIILETPPSHVSHWLHVDLPERIRHLGVPLSTVTATH
jgi:uncharacterized membrane-anchored protein